MPDAGGAVVDQIFGAVHGAYAETTASVVEHEQIAPHRSGDRLPLRQTKFVNLAVTQTPDEPSLLSRRYKHGRAEG